MNYQEALELSLQVRWKVSPCPTGEVCWCRMIEPEEELKDDDGNEVRIVGAGEIQHDHALHIVELHNKWVDL